jgi:hypothetical protein
VVAIGAGGIPKDKSSNGGVVVVAVINGKSFAGMVIIHVIWTPAGGG